MHDFVVAKWRQVDNGETAGELAGTTETLWKEHSRLQRPDRRAPTTAGQHTGHKDRAETDGGRLPFCASKHVAGSRVCVGR